MRKWMIGAFAAALTIAAPGVFAAAADTVTVGGQGCTPARTSSITR